MLNFLKSNISIITKMMVNQVGMMIFGLVLSMATASNETLFLFVSIFSVCFYMVLLYTMSWEVGISDRVKVNAGRLEYKPFRFVWVSLAANIVNIILALLSIIGFVFNSFDALAVHTDWAYNLYATAKIIIYLVEAMYEGLLYTLMPYNPIGHIIIVLPSIAVCAFGYYIGLKGRTIRGLFGIKTAYDNVLESETKTPRE